MGERYTDKDRCSPASLGSVEHLDISPFPLPATKSTHSGALEIQQLVGLQGRGGTLWYHIPVTLQSKQYTRNTPNVNIFLSGSKNIYKEEK